MQTQRYEEGLQQSGENKHEATAPKDSSHLIPKPNAVIPLQTSPGIPECERQK